MDISIIIPTYNRRALLQETLQSCIDFQNLVVEIIVVDDGSTDDTDVCIKNTYPHIRYFKQSRKGAAAARNLGLTHARGEYVKFLDSDDLLHVDGLKQQLQIAQSTNADLAYGRWNFLPKHPVVEGEIQEDLLTFLLTGWWFPNFAYLYNRKFLLRNKCVWQTQFALLDDYHFILSVLMHSPSTVFADSQTGFYRNHAKDMRLSHADENARSKVRGAVLKEVREKLRHQNMLTPIRAHIIDTQINIHSLFAHRKIIQKIWNKIFSRVHTRNSSMQLTTWYSVIAMQ